jgi:hypothetical protein
MHFTQVPQLCVDPEMYPTSSHLVTHLRQISTRLEVLQKKLSDEEVRIIAGEWLTEIGACQPSPDLFPVTPPQ